ncbi:hypothetical protein CAPTEDRAFT_56090, partial [Capitella teleta]
PGKPGRPTTSDATGESILVNWTSPESDGGAEITNYVIEFKPKGSPKWMKFESTEAIPQTSHIVSSLKEDTLYVFRVAAENKAGMGPYSDPSEACKTLIDKPSPPMNLTVTDFSEATISLKWDLPEDDGGSEITGYVIEKRESNKRTWTKVSETTDMELTCSELTKNSQYIFRVAAQNESGVSEFVALTQPITAK